MVASLLHVHCDAQLLALTMTAGRIRDRKNKIIRNNYFHLNIH